MTGRQRPLAGTTPREWTPDAIAREEARRKARFDAGICPDSGLNLHSCHRSICDCFGDIDCSTCGES